MFPGTQMKDIHLGTQKTKQQCIAQAYVSTYS